MPSSRKQSTSPTWGDVKARLGDIDRDGLVRLVADLYAASSDNQAFLHTRFALGDDPVRAYKDVVTRWVYPDVFKRQDVSVAKAKKAITDYRKACGDMQGFVELMTCYCEAASDFAAEFGMDDEGYLESIMRMFEADIKAIASLEAATRTAFLERLDKVRSRCRGFGYVHSSQLRQYHITPTGDAVVGAQSAGVVPTVGNLHEGSWWWCCLRVSPAGDGGVGAQPASVFPACRNLGERL